MHTRETPIRRAMTLLLMVSVASLTPFHALANRSAEGAADAPRHCVIGAESCAANCCESCDHGPAQPASGDESDSQDAPCGESSNCPCCVTAAPGVAPAIVERGTYSFDETAVHTAAPPTATPFYSGWRDALIRPPIC